MMRRYFDPPQEVLKRIRLRESRGTQEVLKRMRLRESRGVTFSESTLSRV